jgi:hypothetical protein
MDRALASSSRFPLVSGQVIARRKGSDRIWPDATPTVPYCEYLLVRNRLGYGEGLMQTSTLLAPKALLETTPFSTGLLKHQDWDWVLRCSVRSDVSILFVEHPVAIWNLDAAPTRVSETHRWRQSVGWIRSVKSITTPRSYASFIAHYVAPSAANDRAYSSCLPLLGEMLKEGSPRVRDIMVYLGAWLAPKRAIRFLRKRKG